MIVIFDDTFSLLAKDYPISFLTLPAYKSKITIIEEFEGSKIKEKLSQLNSIDLIAYHSSFKFRANDLETFLSPELNQKIYENFRNLISDFKLPNVSFSGSIQSTNLNTLNPSMNKKDFYGNLKNLLDYYILHNKIELKILKYGINFVGYELLSVQNNLTYLFDKHLDCRLVSEMLEKEQRILGELDRYNALANVRPDIESLIELIKFKYINVYDLTALLNKITKSYIRYGKCIYNI